MGSFGSRPQGLTFWVVGLGVDGAGGGLEQQGQVREHSWGLAIGCLTNRRKSFTILGVCLAVAVHTV